MKKFLEIIGIDKEKKLSIRERCVIFSEKARSEDGWLMNVIIQFLQYQKRRVSHREITASTLRNYVKVLKLFCEMNDLLVPWEKLTRGLPRAKNYADDRVPRLDEIQKILTYPDWRIKAIVCTMASSGIRLGAWDFLFWEHITPIARDGKLIGSKNSRICWRSRAVSFLRDPRSISGTAELDGFQEGLRREDFRKKLGYEGSLEY